MEKKFSSARFYLFGTVFMLLFFFQLGSKTFAQSATPNSIPPPGKIAPKKILLEQIHKSYTETNHRYRLTVQGDNLDKKAKSNNVGIVNFSWKADCGRFYEGGTGPNTRYFSNKNKTVVWGYEYPKEDCTDAIITVTVTGYDENSASRREDQVWLEQKIFFDEIPPKISAVYQDAALAQSAADSKAHPLKTFFDRLGLKIRSFLGELVRGKDDGHMGYGGVRD